MLTDKFYIKFLWVLSESDSSKIFETKCPYNLFFYKCCKAGYANATICPLQLEVVLRFPTPAKWMPCAIDTCCYSEDTAIRLSARRINYFEKFKACFGMCAAMSLQAVHGVYVEEIKKPLQENYYRAKNFSLVSGRTCGNIRKSSAGTPLRSTTCISFVKCNHWRVKVHLHPFTCIKLLLY